jgi:uncharacterized membrane protein (UPF0127 family)
MNFKLNCTPLRLCAAIFFVFAFAGCGGARPPQPDEITKAQSGLETKNLVIKTASGGEVAVKAELARTARERQIGLMFRKELADGDGMLFIFEKDEVLSFWMKNTLIDLSLAYIKYDGTILEIKEMRAGDLSPVHSSRSVRYALEAPKGWFGRAGVSAGDRLDLGGLK